jgi:UPF0755 protein
MRPEHGSSAAAPARSRKARIMVLVAGAALLAAGLWLFQYLSSELTRPGPLAGEMLVEVPAGATRRQVLLLLERSGAVSDARAAELALRAAGQDPVFKAGRYRLPARASLQQLVRLLASGQVELASLTIPEGWTFAEARAAIERHPAIDASFRGKDEAAVMRALGAAQLPAEGRFFPDTYRFAAGSRDLQIYRQAFTRMQELLESAWETRAADLPLANKDQALVLASIIEKETGVPDERPQIAAVFINRLRQGMRLQSDPTVIYGLGSAYDGNIRTVDLRTDTVYNTYTRNGLPPTPIALPGAGAIAATLRPAASDALFFVATGRGDGRHVFSKDYGAHKRAVDDMLRNQRQATRSAGP